MQVSITEQQILAVAVQGGAPAPPLQGHLEEVDADLVWIAVLVADARRVALPPGTRVRVSWAAPGGLYWFTSEVVAHKTKPAPQLAICRPATVVREQRRDAARVEVWLMPDEATVWAGAAEARAVQVVVADLSATGARLRTREPLPNGAKINLRLALPPDREGIDLIGEVVRTGEPGSGAVAYESGVRFIRPGPREARRLASFVMRVEAEQLR